MVVGQLRHLVLVANDERKTRQCFEVLLRLEISVAHLVGEVPCPSHAPRCVVRFFQVGKGFFKFLPAVQRVSHQSRDVCALSLAEVDVLRKDDWRILDQAVVLFRFMEQLSDVNGNDALQFRVFLQRFEALQCDLSLALQIGNVAEVVPGRQLECPGRLATFHHCK